MVLNAKLAWLDEGSILVRLDWLPEAGCNYNIWDVKTRARSETPVHINTPWVTVVTNASLLER